MWDLDHKERWAPKNWSFQAVVLEKTLENPLDCKEIKPVNPKGSQSWIFIRRTDAEAPVLGAHLMQRANSLERLILGKIEGRWRGWQRIRWLDGITDSMHMSLSKIQEMVEGQGSLACCSPWGHKELDTTVWLNKTTKEPKWLAWAFWELSAYPRLDSRSFNSYFTAQLFKMTAKFPWLSALV